MLDNQSTSQDGYAGSAFDEPAFVLVGKLQKPHGVFGEISMRVDTEFPERIRKGRLLYIGEQHEPVTVQQSRWKGNLLLIKFSGYDSPEAVGSLTNSLVFGHVRDLPPLPKGKYYHHQLIGLKVFESEEYLGHLVSILETGANDVYIVEDANGKELLIPAIPEVIQEIDFSHRKMMVKLLEGLR